MSLRFPSSPEKQSKRVPVRLRHKIEKKVAAKARKGRRYAKKHPELHKKEPEKLNIPNSFPYKDRLLAEIEHDRARKEEERFRRIDVRRKTQKQEGGEGNDLVEDRMEVRDAEQIDGLNSDEDMTESDVHEMEEDEPFAVSALNFCGWW